VINLLGQISVVGLISLIVVLLILTALIVAIFVLVPIKLWFKALTNGARISMVKLAGLKQRNIDLQELVDCYITVKKAGLFIDLDELLTHMTSGGNIKQVASALILADSAKIEVSIDLIKAIDLSGKNVCEEIKNSITPKVIETNEILAVAQDNVELKIKAKVTIKSLLNKIVGGTGEDTILAKVSEGIVSCVSGMGSHTEVMQNPDVVSKAVLLKGVDNKSAYKVISIEISSIEIGRNLNTIMQIEQVELERRRANARAEELKAQAVLQEQKIRCEVENKKIEKLKAEAEVPKAMLKAFEDGKFNIMDYYKMQNIIADTNMRKAWSKAGEDDE